MLSLHLLPAAHGPLAKPNLACPCHAPPLRPRPLNFAHAFRDNAAKFWGALRRTPWAHHLKLALVTAEGLAPPALSRQLFQPLLRLRVESWADVSARLPSRQVGCCCRGSVCVVWMRANAALGP